MKTEDLERDIKHRKEAIGFGETNLRRTKKDVEYWKERLAVLKDSLKALEAELTAKPKWEHGDFENSDNVPRLFIKIGNVVAATAKLGVVRTRDVSSTYGGPKLGNIFDLLEQIGDGGAIVALTKEELERVCFLLKGGNPLSSQIIAKLKAAQEAK